LLVVALGVIACERFVVIKVALAELVLVPVEEKRLSKMRNAPLTPFICAAVRTSPATKVAGRVVGVAIVI